MLIHNYVISRLDYCNSIYYGLPNYLLKKLQNILNRAARLIRGLSPYDRITPVLIDLHWLPIKARIIFKINVFTFQAMKYGKPVYLRELLHDFQPEVNVTLRHNEELFRLEMPRSNSENGFRAFEKCAPRLFNSLPYNVRASQNVEIFRKRLKTFLFEEAFDMNSLSIVDSYRV